MLLSVSEIHLSALGASILSSKEILYHSYAFVAEAVFWKDFWVKSLKGNWSAMELRAKPK